MLVSSADNPRTLTNTLANNGSIQVSGSVTFFDNSTTINNYGSLTFNAGTVGHTGSGVVTTGVVNNYNTLNVPKAVSNHHNRFQSSFLTCDRQLHLL